MGGAHSAAAIAHLAGAGDRARLGVRDPVADQHPGRQRRGAHARNHRAREQGAAAQARRLGRVARLGVGCIARARLPGDRSRRRRETRGDRRRVALRQGVARDDGVRAAIRHRLHRIVGHGRRGAASPPHRRAARERRGQRRISLDGRQLHQVRRPAHRQGSARRCARADRALRAASAVHRRRQSRQGRRVGRSARHVHGDRGGEPGISLVRQARARHRGVPAHRDAARPPASSPTASTPAATPRVRTGRRSWISPTRYFGSRSSQEWGHSPFPSEKGRTSRRSSPFCRNGERPLTSPTSCRLRDARSATASGGRDTSRRASRRW